jgi:hypothetical protein
MTWLKLRITLNNGRSYLPLSILSLTYFSYKQHELVNTKNMLK